jgi:hypothetical protein
MMMTRAALSSRSYPYNTNKVNLTMNTLFPQFSLSPLLTLSLSLRLPVSSSLSLPVSLSLLSQTTDP